MGENRDILISGAGIAGPALASRLVRYGFRPTLVERAPAPPPGGYKVDLRGVAIDVAERMGILPEIRRLSTAMRGASFVDAANRPLATLSADFLAGRSERDDEIMRGDLVRILYERTRYQAEYCFDDAITALAQTDDGVRVTFKHAAPRTFALVVGADGLHSAVRALTFGDEAQFVHHLGAYISIFTVPNRLRLDRWELYYSVPGRLVGIYSAGQDAEAKAAFFFTSPPLAYDHHAIRQQQQLLAEVFADVGWQVPWLLAAMGEAPDFYFDAMGLVQMDRWSTGRVVLLGDAAYCASPASGQGTGLALVGACVLAGELAAAAGDHRLAFARYEDAMRGYVAANQRFAAKAVKAMAPRTRRQVWLRGQLLRLLSHAPWQGRIAGIVARDVRRAANAISLKDYPG
jgi:2-polyprenyl-6-methoxyphenol hydroxylase-like FAD-dependent oxidoreductase